MFLIRKSQERESFLLWPFYFSITTVSAFRRAGDLAMAMEARCYHGGKGRTRLHVLKMHKNDWLAILSMAALMAAVVLISRI